MQTLPHNDQIERNILGVIIVQGKLGKAKLLEDNDFYNEKHKNIFKVMQELDTVGFAVDFITVNSKLNGLASELAGMVTEVASTENLPYYVQLLKETTAKRKMVLSALQTLEDNKNDKLKIELTQETEIPKPLDEFLKSNILPIEYYIEPILPVKGKMMISAQTNVGKSIFIQNLCLAITCGMTRVFDKWNVKSARVLYVDLEMGESPMKDRFIKMCSAKNISTNTLFVKHLPCLNLLQAVESEMLKNWLRDLKIDVLVLDPLGHAWAGNENDNEQVTELTRSLNQIIDSFSTSIVLVHHWRKATKDFKDGGEMAAGSYRWTAWLDTHISLAGEPNNITVSCQKNRHAARFTSWIAKINNETLWIEYITDKAKKPNVFDEEGLINLYDSFNQQEGVKISDICRKAKEQKICSENTVRDVMKASKCFKITGLDRKKILVKVKDEIVELFESTSSDEVI